MQKEIDDARSTADPSLQYECTTLNVNGECLDHLDYTKGTTEILKFMCSMITAELKSWLTFFAQMTF